MAKEKIRVLQGCSIEEGGMWFHQGSVLEVENPDRFTRSVEVKKGEFVTEPMVELTDEPVNIPEGLFPKEQE